jgi:hypothetical protein
MRYAIVKDNIIENICLWCGDEDVWAPPVDVVMVNIENINCDIGWLLIDDQFVPPEQDNDEV